MAGPTFSFLYLPSSAPSLAQLRTALEGSSFAIVGASTTELHVKLARDDEIASDRSMTLAAPRALPPRGSLRSPTPLRGSGSIYLGVGESEDAADWTLTERAAFTAAIGGVPAVAVFGYAMASRDLEPMCLLAERVAAACGGWVHTRRLGDVLWAGPAPDEAIVRIDESSWLVAARHVARQAVFS